MARLNTSLVRFVLTVAGVAAGTAVLGKIARDPVAQATGAPGPAGAVPATGDSTAVSPSGGPPSPPCAQARRDGTRANAGASPLSGVWRPGAGPAVSQPPPGPAYGGPEPGEESERGDDRDGHEGYPDDEWFEQEDNDAWEHGAAVYLYPGLPEDAGPPAPGSPTPVLRTRRS